MQFVVDQVYYVSRRTSKKTTKGKRFGASKAQVIKKQELTFGKPLLCRPSPIERGRERERKKEVETVRGMKRWRAWRGKR